MGLFFKVCSLKTTFFAAVKRTEQRSRISRVQKVNKKGKKKHLTEKKEKEMLAGALRLVNNKGLYNDIRLKDFC